MPARMSWGRYLTFLAASLGSMLAGASVVHNYYKPNLRIPEVPPNPHESASDEHRSRWNKMVSIKKD